jgi:uncharacterized protein (TIGR00369 family)
MSKLFDKIMLLKKTGDLKGMEKVIPYTSFINLSYERDDSGLITVMRSTESNIGNITIPAVHGGVVGALLEQAGIMQVIWESEITRFPKIINISVDYLRPCLAKEDTYARATLIKQGRSVSNVRVSAWQSDPTKPVAAAHVHFLMG